VILSSNNDCYNTKQDVSGAPLVVQGAPSPLRTGSMIGIACVDIARDEFTRRWAQCAPMDAFTREIALHDGHNIIRTDDALELSRDVVLEGPALAPRLMGETACGSP